jgi:hypothetical protein
MNPMLEDEIAELLRNTYGGDANVELTGDGGMNIWVYPARGGSLHACLSGVNSPVLAALLSVHRVAGNSDQGDSR